MNDPWDVKAVRLGHQYQSCMKINGVPLLPPVLSKDCRKEMQYYKILAKEVEKRISLLKQYSQQVSNDDDDDEKDNMDAIDSEQYLTSLAEKYSIASDGNEVFYTDTEPSTSDINNGTQEVQYQINHEHIVINVNMQFENDFKYNSAQNPCRADIIDKQVPERDYTSQNGNEKANEVIEIQANTEKYPIDSMIKFNFDNDDSDKEDCLALPDDGHSSLSSKTFTGSLVDIHTDSLKESQPPKLIRQRSYTVLQPSPQLLAHLEYHAHNTGIDVKAISMSESMSEVGSKKRKSWDLESAKMKWSKMAKELKAKNISAKSSTKPNVSPYAKKLSYSPPKHNSEAKERIKKDMTTHSPKSEPIQYKKEPNSLVNKVADRSPLNQTSCSVNYIPAKRTPKATDIKDDSNKTEMTISDSNSPSVRVKQLYEKLQQQQLMQMAKLMDKQRKEQEILQQLFKEQNNTLLKQLKTVCPKGSIEMKQAWGEAQEAKDRGPVSLSQLMNTSTPNQSTPASPIAQTLKQSNNCINKCEDILKKSRDITSSIKRNSRSRNASNNSDQIAADRGELVNGGTATRTHSPNRNTSRRLNYDEIEPMLTDRSNDTMADVNISLPTDATDSEGAFVNDSVRRNGNPDRPTTVNRQRNNESTIRNVENNNQSQNSSRTKKGRHSAQRRTYTTEERVAASTIVAYAKGYLVRRLMRTERVQATVQTIKDALLCALQLHQDRQGIRGADVDLHRRLIQQITSACYSLHETFISSSPAERCATIASDRARRHALASKTHTPVQRRPSDVMSQSHSGAFPARGKREGGGGATDLMTQSNYETFSVTRSRSRMLPGLRRVPWR